jgi:hypothetical protein
MERAEGVEEIEDNNVNNCIIDNVNPGEENNSNEYPVQHNDNDNNNNIADINNIENVGRTGDETDIMAKINEEAENVDNNINELNVYNKYENMTGEELKVIIKEKK